MNREQAIEFLRGSKLSAHFDALVGALKPSARLHREPVSIDDAPLGASRFGGPPDLPPGFVWPVWNQPRRSGFLWLKRTTRVAALDFLAQINLEELAAAAPEALPGECPREGILYFFYDMDDMPWGADPAHNLAFRVAYATGFSKLTRQDGPPAGKAGPPRPCLIRAETEWVLPDQPDFLDCDEEQSELYTEEVAAGLCDGDGVVHRMFGHPQCVQGAEEVFHGDDSRILLMQIDTDDSAGGSPGWMWGDCGRLYFTIPAGDLGKPDLTTIRMCLQCH